MNWPTCEASASKLKAISKKLTPNSTKSAQNYAVTNAIPRQSREQRPKKAANDARLRRANVAQAFSRDGGTVSQVFNLRPLEYSWCVRTDARLFGRRQMQNFQID